MEHLLKKVKELAHQNFSEVVSIRQHLHANPELSFQEFNTSKFIALKLKEYGINFITQQKGIETGIVATIEGNNPTKKIIALRADMDALPIKEENNVEYKSKNEGIMHACGHDVHSASLLGTIRILSQLKKDFEGTVKIIFQPGEEKLPGGASLMIKAGVLKNPNPQKIFGQHVLPSMEVGKVGFRSGMYMASTDEIYIKIKGKGGHAAMPENYINPLLIASQILLSLQSEFMDEKNKTIPSIPTVLAFGKINANGATNVIPDEVNIEGTFRTMDEKWRSEAHYKMKTMAEYIAKSMQGSCEFNIVRGYPFLSNDELTTSIARISAEEFLGKENVEELPLRMTAEDFSYYTQEMPGCFYRLGTGNKSKGIISGVHTSTFDIDEKSLEIGMGLMAWIALKELAN